MVHGDGRSTKETIVDWILKKYPEIKDIGEPYTVGGKILPRPGIVHRLDEETSGAMVIAKTQETFEYLKQQFKDRLVTKEYQAFVRGHFKEDGGVVDVEIGRNKNDFRRWHAGRGTRGETKEAITKWSVVSMFKDEKDENFSFVNLYPKTGRTHQLRVHMKYLQRPIVSDALYGGSNTKALGFDRVALHARKISLSLSNGQKIEIEAPYPKDFEKAIETYIWPIIQK